MATIYTLYKQLMDYHHKLDPYAYPKYMSYKKYLDGKLEKSEIYTLKKDGKLVGMSLYYIQDRKMTITDLIVDKKHRGSGYGSKILNVVEKIAKRRNCKSIRLQVSWVNEIAHNLYTRNGFKEASVTMYKKLK